MGGDPPAPTRNSPADGIANATAEFNRVAGEADHAVHALRPALDGLFNAPPRPATDLYNPRGTPTDQLHQMHRAIFFRPGMAHEVAAMGRGRGEAEGAHGDEGVRVIRDGRMIAVPSRRGSEDARSEGAHRANHPAAAAAREAAAQLRNAMGEALSHEELNLFERIFMAHFEGGIPLGDHLQPGQHKFLTKTEKAWMEFFQRFGPFTFQKKTSQGDVQLLVFRGLFKGQDQTKSGQKDKSQQPALFLVSDMKFADGKTDKFARLLIQGEGLGQTVGEHQPGDVLGKELLAQIAEKLGGEEFSYLSLSHKVVNPEMGETAKNPLAEAYKSPEQMKGEAIREGTRDVSQGIALSARTEQLIAEKLDLNLKARGDLGDVAAAGRRGAEGKAPPGIELGGLFADKKKRRGQGDGADEGGDSASPYIPWWMAPTKPKTFKGKARWWVPFLYFLGASALALAAVYAVRSFT
ncbi:MAG TPA: hypothetical protein VFX30_10135 [bacterium]|nr:hypothetical protein [bacterium]